MISSRANPKIKYIRRLQKDRRFRYRESSYVAEGDRWLDELLKHSVRPEFICYTKEWSGTASLHAGLDAIECPTYLVSTQVMTFISDTKTAPGILAVLTIPKLPLPKSPSLLLILDAVANPGNLGTMIRSAAAAGVDALLLGPDCVDPFGPKAIRGGMGAQLRLPIRQTSWEKISEIVSRVNVWLAAANGNLTYSAVDWSQPSALIIGSEARGASERAQALVKGKLSIPMHAATESLNAAVAAGIILFEAARQRRLTSI